jgi:hypothetical protein
LNQAELKMPRAAFVEREMPRDFHIDVFLVPGLHLHYGPFSDKRFEACFHSEIFLATKYVKTRRYFLMGSWWLTSPAERSNFSF